MGYEIKGCSISYFFIFRGITEGRVIYKEVLIDFKVYSQDYVFVKNYENVDRVNGSLGSIFSSS